MSPDTPASDDSLGERLKAFWARLGAKLGITLCLGGFVVLFLGWNGAASFDRVPAQFPYLISGGLTGLSLVVIGAALIIVDNNRRERAELRATLEELRLAVETMGVTSADGHRDRRPLLVPEPGQVVAGASSYHRPTCRLVEGREGLTFLSPAEAESAGLSPCRVCEPPTSEEVGEGDETAAYAAEDESAQRPRRPRKLRAR